MECIATLKDDIHNKQKEIEESRRVHMEELKSLQSSHVEALQALAKKHQEEVTTLKVTITQLENEVQRLMEANDNSTAAISKDLVKIQEKYKLLKGEYESKKREGEVAQSTYPGIAVTMMMLLSCHHSLVMMVVLTTALSPASFQPYTHHTSTPPSHYTLS
jgi:predicted RNase H-like nuclease (RuvC/YqgF family)